jgi:ABC-type Fe3+/spermidine/putrescine transport system ATPase subunit
MAHLEIRAVRKSYRGSTALQDVSLDVASGEFLTLLGPSGCGKTTLLRSIAGLVEVDHGQIVLGGNDLSRQAVHERGIGMVFQAHALFPHMSVLDNVGFGLRMRGAPKRSRDESAERALALVRLGGLERRMPQELSGGQQQRVAIARAIVIEPGILLLDEPFGALDRKLREILQVELRRVTRQLGVTAIFVTHDQEEALVLSDRIAVMDRGQIAQVGTPAQIFDRPATRFVADFMGVENILEATVAAHAPEGAVLRVGDVTVQASSVPDAAARAGARVAVGIRSQRVRLAPGNGASGPNAVAGRVRDAIYRGNAWTYRVATPVGDVLCAVDGGEALAPDMPVRLSWDAADVRVLTI